MLKNKEELDPCTIELNIEVEPERVAEAFEDAFKRYAKRVTVPGFRKGKAPRAMVERYIDEGALREDAARSLLPPALDDAVKEAEIDPYDLPDVEFVQFQKDQPLIFKARFPLPPKVELGDYVNLTVERMVRKVSDEEVDKNIMDIRERAAVLKPIEPRPVKKGDTVVLEIQSGDDDPNTKMALAGSNLPEIDAKLIGMSPGDKETIEVQYPDDYHDKELAGKNLQLKIKVIEIKERIIPELDDELAKSAGFESAEALRKEIRANMENTAANLEERYIESQVIAKVIDNSTIHFPSEMVEHEVEHRLEDMMKRLADAKYELKDYLDAKEKTFDELKDEMASEAERDIRNSLAIVEVAKRENIVVTDEDVEAEINRMAAEKDVPKPSMQAYIDGTDGIDRLKSRLLYKKTLDFLVSSSNIKNVAMKGDSE